MREFAGETRNCRIDLSTGTIWLSRIFDWFDDDFLAFERRHGASRPSVIAYVNRYREPGAQLPDGLRLRFLDYDKRLNRK